MRLEIQPDFRLQLLRAEAEARGLLGRLGSVAAAREADGLDAAEAEAEAADSLGLADEVDEALQAAAEPLETLGVERLILDDAHAGMPTLRRDETFAHFAHDPATATQLARTLALLAGQLARDPDRTVATLAVGLGGSGGCSGGDCLPEDAPAGPLFEPRPR